MEDVFLRRVCQIETAAAGTRDLFIDFDRPSPIDGAPYPTFRGKVRIHCDAFDEVHALQGGDELSVLAWLMNLVVERLRSIQKSDGSEIYWIENGDLDFSDFWSYRV